MKATVEQALQVPCRYCHAQPGEQCRTAMGTIDRSGNPHWTRYSDAARATKRGELQDPHQGRLL